MHARITQGVKSRFRYDGLDAQFWKTRQATLLRSICLKVGIQIQSKIYDFTDSTFAIFAASDILNIYPIVKQALPRAVFASEALEHGRMSVTSGQKETGLEIMREAISMTEQIYGPVHSESGQAYAGFAMFLFNLEDPVQAVLYQRRAVIVSERCNGIDSAQTLQQYVSAWEFVVFSFSKSKSNNTSYVFVDELGLLRICCGKSIAWAQVYEVRPEPLEVSQHRIPSRYSYTFCKSFWISHCS